MDSMDTVNFSPVVALALYYRKARTEALRAAGAAWSVVLQPHASGGLLCGLMSF
jgi:hypothetical protein